MSNKKTTYRNFFILALLSISAIVFLGNVTVFQTTEVKSDGSGTLNFSYSAQESLLKTKNYLIGNLPFDQAKLKEYFLSPNNQVKKAFVVKDKNDSSLLRATINIEFKDVTKISEAKGFAGINSKWTKTDTGMVFRWIIPDDFFQANMIDKLTYSFTFEDEIKSANGNIKDKTVTWFRDVTKLDSAKNFVFTATLNSTGGVPSGEKEKKSCGLFGLELPVIILAGLIFGNRFRAYRK